jgi:tol-pal system protein YbgF
VPTRLAGRRTAALSPALNNSGRQTLAGIHTTKKAQGGILLCLSLLALTSAVPALAQSDELTNRLRRIENELDTLNRAVYKGDKSEMPAPLSSDASGDNGAANAEVRLQQMESQIRELTGKLEQKEYDIQQLQTRLDRMEAAGRTAATPPQPASANTAMQTTSGSMNTATAQPNPALTPEDSALPSPAAEPTPGLKTATPQKGDDPASLYEAAYGHLKAGNHDMAQAGFNDFLKQYPDHVLAANAMYWLGESYYVRAQYDQAAKTFAQAYQKYPGGPKGADNLLKLGMSLNGTGKKTEACIALAQVAKEYPNGPAPVLRKAEQEMATLDCR